MRLALLVIAFVAPTTLLPTAAADATICQATAATSTCATAYTTNGWAYLVACQYAPLTSACVGGGHYDHSPTPWIGNSAGGNACVSTVCGGAVVGQHQYYGYFVGFGGGAVSTSAASAGAVAYAGSYNGAPYRSGAVCASTLVTGGTCLLV
ncbi:MAG TPA: hypothetical protein VM582_04260 [Candidatus Thermoplasmatota archaeon]|nr:hypothetical protein [Candidatus Thermoplasmatota archaeon]